MTITIEEALTAIGERAALLRSAAEGFASAPGAPTPPAFGGTSDVCTEIEELAAAIKRAFDANALNIDVERRNAVHG